MPEDEEYIRSVQMGLMSPLSRSHGQATPREPWIFSETAQAALLKINKLRYRCQCRRPAGLPRGQGRFLQSTIGFILVIGFNAITRKISRDDTLF